VETGALPASARPQAVPRAPKWAATVAASYGRRGLSGMKGGKAETAMSSERLANFKDKQFETLEVFRKCQQDATWDRIHRGHFDWWMFPIDDGSKPDFNVNSE
ncbi:unnamed protein product, partial [Polarella glacialis]